MTIEGERDREGVAIAVSDESARTCFRLRDSIDPRSQRGGIFGRLDQYTDEQAARVAV